MKQYVMLASLLVIVMEIDCVRFMDWSEKRLVFDFVITPSPPLRLKQFRSSEDKSGCCFFFFFLNKIFSVIEFDLKQISGSFCNQNQ